MSRNSLNKQLWYLGVKVGDYVIGQNFIAEVVGTYAPGGKQLRRLSDGKQQYINKDNFRNNFKKCKTQNIIRYLYV